MCSKWHSYYIVHPTIITSQETVELGRFAYLQFNQQSDLFSLKIPYSLFFCLQDNNYDKKSYNYNYQNQGFIPLCNCVDVSSYTNTNTDCFMRSKYSTIIVIRVTITTTISNFMKRHLVHRYQLLYMCELK